MKNKLLVSAFALAIAMLTFSSCERKSDVKDVCTDLVQVSLHKSARSLLQLKGETLTISEYEFPSTNVNDKRLIYRTISFGNGTYEAKTVENLTYEYGEWNEDNTQFSLLVNQPGKAPYTLWFRSNALITPDGRAFGGDVSNSSARVEKWEKALSTIVNTSWKATFKGEYVVDSIFRDSIRSKFIPGKGTVKDTIKIFDHLDSVSADTSCVFKFDLTRDPITLANTGHFYQRGIRTTYDRATKTATEVPGTELIKEFDYSWFFSGVSSAAKFVITLKSTEPNAEDTQLNISNYVYTETQDTTTVPPSVKVKHEFLLNGLTYEAVTQP